MFKDEFGCDKMQTKTKQQKHDIKRNACSRGKTVEH